MSRKYAADQQRVRDFSVRAIARGTQNLAQALQDEFRIARPTAHNYINSMIQEGLISRTNRGHYQLREQAHQFYHAVSGLQEHEVWAQEIAPLLADLPPNVLEIFHYGCTEMINNVIDHSESDDMMITVLRTPVETEVAVQDRGIGIFRKIARALHLDDDRHAVLELSKGKVTTDPDNHTGEGIFFSSRAFDEFDILSGGVFFRHQIDREQDWIVGDERRRENVEGTGVYMTMDNDSKRRLSETFDAYATSTDDYKFDKTVVPVKLLQYGDDHLVSRSQGKRLMNRFDRFKTVVLDFEDIESIGQAFADEVFRVFPAMHPEIEVIAVNTNEQVSRMMNRAMSAREPQRSLFSPRDANDD